MANDANAPGVNVTASAAPTNKAVAATGGSAIGAAVATILLYLFDPHQSLPAGVSTAVTTLVTAVVTLAAAYFTPPGSNEAVIVTPDGAKSARTQ
jgi:hypothetical protein